MSDKIDKVFDLLEKVYTELQDTRIELHGTTNELHGTTKEVTKLSTTIENEIKPDIKAIYQMQTDVMARLDNHELRLKAIEESVERLSAKSLRHSYEIGAIKRKKKA